MILRGEGRRTNAEDAERAENDDEEEEEDRGRKNFREQLY
jgi:hypothetical protein